MRGILRRLLRRGPSDEERVADACMGAPGDGLVVPGVTVHEANIPVVRSIPQTSLSALIGPAHRGPVSEPVLIGPSVRKPRWWEVWRWHTYPRWRRESRAATSKFEEAFGLPVRKVK